MLLFFFIFSHLGYQAPESVRWNEWRKSEEKTIDMPPRPGPPADIWSAGCIVAEVCLESLLCPSFQRKVLYELIK